MNRRETNTGRVLSSFGTHYVHVEHEEGVVKNVWISSPGKFDSTELKDFLEKLAGAVSGEIREVQKRWAA